MIKTYYLLTKPGIILGNLITVFAGFTLAAKTMSNYPLLLATLIGLACTIACACILNNYIDRNLDQKMERTKHRPFALKLVSVPKALLLATALGLVGIVTLSISTNLLTVLMAATGLFVYVILYSLGKTRTLYATLIGSISGAMPPLVGYCAVKNQLDMAALLLFAMLVLWQMAHFFAIAIYRLNDYKSANIPLLPIKKGLLTTKVHILLYVAAFMAASLMLSLLNYTGYLYFSVAALLGVTWLYLSLKGFTNKNETLWARQMFIFSLVVITTLSTFILVDCA